MKKPILFMLSLVLTTPVFAYPVFFQCDADGRLTDQMTTPQVAQKMQEMLSSLASATGSEKAKKISEYCQGGAQCIQEMRELLQLAEISGKITDEAISAEIAQVMNQAKLSAQKLGSLVKVPEGIFTSVGEYQNSINSLAVARECRVAVSKIDPELMKNDAKECLLANFHHTPYMYPAGVRVSGNSNTNGDKVEGKAQCSIIDDVIQTALVTDHDPFAALAISLMENGSSVEYLSLDPIGVVKTLGCQTSPGTSSSHEINSYGTFYHAKAEVTKNPKLLRNIEDMAKLDGLKLKLGKSALCYPFSAAEDDNQNLQVLNTPIPKSCCVEVPYSSESMVGVDIDKLLTYTSFDKYLTTPLESNIDHSDPMEKVARRLQRFNGYSDSMGGAEVVSAWRSGVNFYKTPTYGYQTVDFILNTLWNNPYVRQKISEFENKLGKNPRVSFAKVYRKELSASTMITSLKSMQVLQE